MKQSLAVALFAAIVASSSFAQNNALNWLSGTKFDVQVCQSELQQLTVAQADLLKKGATPQTIANVMYDIQLRIESLWDIRDKSRCPASLWARCEAFPKGMTPSSPDYGDALKVSAEIFVGRAATWGRQDHDYFQFLLYACVARQMAAQLKPKRKHQGQ